MKTLWSLMAAVAMLLGMQCAYADNWAFTYADLNGGTTAFGSGTFETGALVGSSYALTDITGTANGLAITGLSNYASADNLLYPTAPFVDVSGISFHTSGGPDWNLAYLSGGFNGINYTGQVALNSSFDPGTGLVQFTAINLSVAAVPEPESYAMMLAGLGLLVLIARRRMGRHAA